MNLHLLPGRSGGPEQMAVQGEVQCLEEDLQVLILLSVEVVFWCFVAAPSRNHPTGMKLVGRFGTETC